MTLRSWSNMNSDRALADEIAPAIEPDSWRWKVNLWFTYYWWPTRRWMPRLSLWWHYNVLRYPKPPPLQLDPVAIRLGLVPDPTETAPND